jgi:hypothetical protein
MVKEEFKTTLSVLHVFGVFVIVSFLLFNVSSSHAFSIMFTPQDQQTSLGNKVSVDVVITDIPENAAVDNYSLSVHFNSAILSPYALVIYDPLALSGVYSTATTIPLYDAGLYQGLDKGLKLHAFFNYDPIVLINQQPHDFILATIMYDASAYGTSGLQFSWGLDGLEGYVSGANGIHRNLALDAGVNLVGGQVSVVPGPPTMLLLFSGIICLGIFRLRNKRSEERNQFPRGF